jgi:hypothetical protein
VTSRDDKRVRELLRESPVEREIREERERAGVDAPWIVEHKRRASRRFYAATMLTNDLDTCGSILRGLPVRAGKLDSFVFRRALRGDRLPDPESYLVVTDEMLDAIAESEPLSAKEKR